MPPPRRRRRSRLLAPLALLLTALSLTTVFAVSASQPSPRRAPSRAATSDPAAQAPAPAERRPPGPRRRPSIAVGTPEDGRLVRGVRLPASGRHFATWNPIRRGPPNAGWRRNGTDTLVRTLLRVAARYAPAGGRGARMLIGDLSRPQGGDFGPRYGIIGHASHQNGRDADVYYPLTDGREAVPLSVDQIDRSAAQHLVDLFVAAGAERVYVGPNTGLSGPSDVVLPAAGHDNHLHVRL